MAINYRGEQFAGYNKPKRGVLGRSGEVVISVPETA